jgi:hypothetical protein
MGDLLKSAPVAPARVGRPNLSPDDGDGLNVHDPPRSIVEEGLGLVESTRR